MKLYATVTSERAKKGQGGNKEIVVEFMVGSAKASRTVAFVKLKASLTLYDLIYTNVENMESEVLQVGSITGEKQKGDAIHESDVIRDNNGDEVEQ